MNMFSNLKYFELIFLSSIVVPIKKMHLVCLYDSCYETIDFIGTYGLAQLILLIAF